MPSATIDQAALNAAGLTRGGKDGVRLLGKGEFSAKLNFTVAGVSKGAREAVEKAGGSVNVPEIVPAADKAKAKHRVVQKAKAEKKAAFQEVSRPRVRAERRSRSHGSIQLLRLRSGTIGR